jgi:superfamily I DNA/RNA helicase
MDDMVYITKFPTEQLVFNHRLPKKVARVAEYINSESDVLERRCQNEGTELPKIFEYRTFEEQLDAIIQIIRNRNFEDVGILFRHNRDVDRATAYFKAHGLPNVEAKINESIDLNFKSDNPKIMTYHSAKGLQFEAIFMPKLEDFDDSQQKSLYVAATRTYKYLYMMWSDYEPDFLSNIPKELYETEEITTIDDF